MDNINFYFAPMEGITTYIFRNLFNKYFGGIDKYFMPFLAPGNSKGLKKKEIRDIIPQNNEGIKVVPQILTNNAESFLRTEKLLKDYGYEEVNLNVGCPSGTVVAKHKGAGMLQDTYRFEKFLDEIFGKSDINISIKTRIGMEDKEEFEEILELYNKYNISELIVHPRIRNDYYKNTIHMDSYEYALNNSKASLCYNGDIVTVNDFESLISIFPATDKIMIGRGMLSNPFLVMEIKGTGTYDREIFRQFHKELVEAYIEEMGDDNALFKMKELWIYFSEMFEDKDKCVKRIRKINKMSEYKKATEEIMRC